VQGIPPLGGVKQWWGGEISYFVAVSLCLENCRRYVQSDRKMHMRFWLTPVSMSLDDLELYEFEFSENFSGFRGFRTQQQLCELR